MLLVLPFCQIDRDFRIAILVFGQYLVYRFWSLIKPQVAPLTSGGMNLIFSGDDVHLCKQQLLNQRVYLITAQRKMTYLWPSE